MTSIFARGRQHSACRRHHQHHPTRRSQASRPSLSGGERRLAATVDLSQKALALLKGDKDWTPGQIIDSY